ncbi:hypothetical protein ACFL0N_02350 [Pseudomonadota bacterium]
MFELPIHVDRVTADPRSYSGVLTYLVLEGAEQRLLQTGVDK